VLLRRLEVGVRIDPGLVFLPRAPARLLAEVLLDGVDEVLTGDPRALVRVVDERGHVEDVLQALGVVLPEVAAARSVEARDRSAAVAAIERRSGLAEIAVGTGGHAGEETYPFRHDPDTHARDRHGYVRAMDEARAVLERLRRIEVLEREGAPARSLLAEVHALVEEADAWLAVEGSGTELADAALESCRAALVEPAAAR
jgi:hypothetical protein